MTRMLDALEKGRQRLRRERAKKLPASALVGSMLRYAAQTLTAPVYLRGVTRVGAGVRTLGRPRIDNLGQMTIGDDTLLRSINVPVELATGAAGTLEIGREVRLDYGVSIGAMGSVRIGDRVRIGPYAMILDTEFHDLYDRSTMPTPRPVVIEHDAQIGAKASIMPGVTLGAFSIVSTSAVVTSDVAPYTVVAGVPAREVRKVNPGPPLP